MLAINSVRYLVVELRGLVVQPCELSGLLLLVQDESRKVAQASRLVRRKSRCKRCALRRNRLVLPYFIGGQAVLIVG